MVEGRLVEKEARQGGLTLTEVDPKMLHNITTKLSRLVVKSMQLIGNYTTNLAECWMHILAKFDGGKVINRLQSGSWELRCMGVWFHHNLGAEWGPQAWKVMTHYFPNKIFSTVANNAVKKAEDNMKRKATDKAKEGRQKRKYTRMDDTAAAHSAYNRRDGGISPEELDDDIPSD